jgi:hypothetical protein
MIQLVKKDYVEEIRIPESQQIYWFRDLTLKNGVKVRNEVQPSLFNVQPDS